MDATPQPQQFSWCYRRLSGAMRTRGRAQGTWENKLGGCAARASEFSRVSLKVSDRACARVFEGLKYRPRHQRAEHFWHIKKPALVGLRQGCNRRRPVYNRSDIGIKPREIQKRLKNLLMGRQRARMKQKFRWSIFWQSSFAPKISKRAIMPPYRRRRN